MSWVCSLHASKALLSFRQYIFLFWWCLWCKRSYYTIEDKGLYIHLITHIGEGYMCNLYSLSIHTSMRTYHNGGYEVIALSTLIYIDTYNPTHHDTHLYYIYIHSYTPPPIHHYNTSLPLSLQDSSSPLYGFTIFWNFNLRP